jgi:hypothetical protein
LRVFEDRVLRRISGLKRWELTGDWIKPHNEELRKLHSSPNIITMINQAGWDGRIIYHTRYWLSSLKGRPRRPWKDSIEIGLWEIGWEGVDWIHLAQDRDRWRAVVNTVMNIWVHKKRGISWLSERTVGLSRTTLPQGVKQ